MEPSPVVDGLSFGTGQPAQSVQTGSLRGLDLVIRQEVIEVEVAEATLWQP